MRRRGTSLLLAELSQSLSDNISLSLPEPSKHIEVRGHMRVFVLTGEFLQEAWQAAGRRCRGRVCRGQILCRCLHPDKSLGITLTPTATFASKIVTKMKPKHRSMASMTFMISPFLCSYTFLSTTASTGDGVILWLYCFALIPTPPQKPAYAHMLL